MEEDTGSTRSVGWELPWSMRRHEKIGGRSNDIRLNSSPLHIGPRGSTGDARRGAATGGREWGEAPPEAPPARASEVWWRAADSNRRWYPCCALKFKELLW